MGEVCRAQMTFLSSEWGSKEAQLQCPPCCHTQHMNREGVLKGLVFRGRMCQDPGTSCPSLALQTLALLYSFSTGQGVIEVNDTFPFCISHAPGFQVPKFQPAQLHFGSNPARLKSCAECAPPKPACRQDTATHRRPGQGLAQTAAEGRKLRMELEWALCESSVTAWPPRSLERYACWDWRVAHMSFWGFHLDL